MLDVNTLLEPANRTKIDELIVPLAKYFSQAELPPHVGSCDAELYRETLRLVSEGMNKLHDAIDTISCAVKALEWLQNNTQVKGKPKDALKACLRALDEDFLIRGRIQATGASRQLKLVSDIKSHRHTRKRWASHFVFCMWLCAQRCDNSTSF